MIDGPARNGETILRYAASSRADGRAQSDGRIQIGIAAGSGPEVDRLVAIWGVRISSLG